MTNKKIREIWRAGKNKNLMRTPITRISIFATRCPITLRMSCTMLPTSTVSRTRRSFGPSKPKNSPGPSSSRRWSIPVTNIFIAGSLMESRTSATTAWTGRSMRAWVMSQRTSTTALTLENRKLLLIAKPKRMWQN